MTPAVAIVFFLRGSTLSTLVTIFRLSVGVLFFGGLGRGRGGGCEVALLLPVRGEKGGSFLDPVTMTAEYAALPTRVGAL